MLPRNTDCSKQSFNYLISLFECKALAKKASPSISIQIVSFSYLFGTAHLISYCHQKNKDEFVGFFFITLTDVLFFDFYSKLKIVLEELDQHVNAPILFFIWHICSIKISLFLIKYILSLY